MIRKLSITRYACYSACLTMSVIANVSPLLFVPFHQMYDISYGLLGTLVLINYVTQLSIDLIFSFYSHKFNIPVIIRCMPIITIAGFAVFSVMPSLFPENAYIFIAIGTVIFSCAAGLSEVLVSPIFAALPSDNPDRDMSRMHSVYAWGTAVVVLLCTLFLSVFGRERWNILILLCSAIPFCSAILFMFSEIPRLETPESSTGTFNLLKNNMLILCVACLFMSGASEGVMSQWCSGYLEAALGIPKLWGDVFGVALFAVTLGLGRTLYAKFGKNISKILLVCFIGTTICYFTAALTGIPFVGLAVCVLTGFCVSMLWPGTLILTAEKVPNAGVAVYALLASGGDLGAAVGPQLMGSIVDVFAENGLFSSLLPVLNMTSEQLGFKAGMTAAAVFPIIGIIIIAKLRKSAAKQNKL